MLPLREARRRFEREYISYALAKYGSMTAAARALKYNRTAFYRLCAQLGVEYKKRRKGTWELHDL